MGAGGWWREVKKRMGRKEGKGLGEEPSIYSGAIFWRGSLDRGQHGPEGFFAFFFFFFVAKTQSGSKERIRGTRSQRWVWRVQNPPRMTESLAADGRAPLLRAPSGWCFPHKLVCLRWVWGRGWHRYREKPPSVGPPRLPGSQQALNYREPPATMRRALVN